MILMSNIMLIDEIVDYMYNREVNLPVLWAQLSIYIDNKLQCELFIYFSPPGTKVEVSDSLNLRVQ